MHQHPATESDLRELFGDGFNEDYQAETQDRGGGRHRALAPVGSAVATIRNPDWPGTSGMRSSPIPSATPLPGRMGRMPPKTTDLVDDEELETLADETAQAARRVVAAYATDAEEAVMLFNMLGIAPEDDSDS